jgi:DNA polymerase phi
MEEEEDDNADDASEDSSDDDAEDDDEDGDEQVDAEFRRRVAEALQVAGMANGDATVDREDAEGSDDDDDDEEDSDDDAESVTESISMDDDQMLALDEKLASIFKERRTGKKGNNAGKFGVSYNAYNVY